MSGCFLSDFAYDDVFIYEGGYVAEINVDQFNEVNLSLVTVTFKKEDFITRNLRLLENEIIYSDEELADHIFVRVIDNGRTLNENEWNSEKSIFIRIQMLVDQVVIPEE